MLENTFYCATEEEVNNAVELAKSAFEIYKNLSGSNKADFLEAIAEEIVNLGDELVKTAMTESALPEGRIVGERGRTVNQLKMFAQPTYEMDLGLKQPLTMQFLIEFPFQNLI